MTSQKRYLRPYQPQSSDFNAAFVRDYVAEAETGSTADLDGRIADPDATLGGLVESTFKEAFPPVISTDCAVRVGFPKHSAFVALIIWSTFAFTLPYLLCFVCYQMSWDGAIVACCWCCGVFIVQAMLGSFAKEDATLFFLKLVQHWHGCAWLVLAWFLWSFRISAFLPVLILGVFVDRVIAFTSQPDPAGSLRAAVRVVWALTLLFVVGQTLGSVYRPNGLAFLYLAGNCLFALPMVWGMQHWFAANRYAGRDDVRRYGQGAAAGRLAVTRILRAAWAYLVAAIAAVVCSFVVVSFFPWTKTGSGAAGANAASLAFILIGIVAVGVIHWGAIEISLHHRLPKPSRYFASLYATWRTVAAWLSYEAQFDHPAVFQFQRPFTAVSIRRGVVLASLWVNTAVTIGQLSVWSGEFLASRSASASAETDASLPGKLGQIAEIVSEPEFWVPLFASGVLIPPLVFLLSVHAVWGPTFLAFAEHFECFQDETIPPLVNAPFASRRKGRRGQGSTP